jgi:rhodanese-related sulfurtransferase
MFLQRGLVATLLVLPKRSHRNIVSGLAAGGRKSSFRSSPLQRQQWSMSTFARQFDFAESKVEIKHIGRAEMKQLLDQPENESVVVIDVRTDEEVQATGKLAPHVHTLPVQVIHAKDAFKLSDDDFEDVAGFSKPALDQTLVFTCAAGIRSVYACRAAELAGYSKLVNYKGGAHEWFDYSWYSPSDDEGGDEEDEKRK